MEFRNTAKRQPSRTSVAASGWHGRRPSAADRNTKSPLRASLVLLALAGVVIVGAVGCGVATTSGTPAATPAASQTTPTPSQTPSSAAPAPAPVHTTSLPAAPAPAAPPPPAASPAPAAGCYPISDEGTCYEPGEYCRDDDHGVTGVAGDGESIECEDNDGWRWEPV
jgi:hypothetical protein